MVVNRSFEDLEGTVGLNRALEFDPKVEKKEEVMNVL